jgi:hypothetical protein
MTRLRADGNLDLDQFTDLIKETLDKVWGRDWGTFSDENPTDNDPSEALMPHITYNLVERTIAGEMGAAKRKFFDQEEDPDNPGHHITHYRIWFNCELEFCIYAKTRREAMKLAQRFEIFMEDYTGYFMQKGVSHINFQVERSPQVSSEYRQDIPHRTVRYSVRIERITTVRSIDVTQVTTDVVVTDQVQLTPPPASVKAQSSALMNHYNEYYK